MPKTKVEVYDKDQLIYPYIESDHVTFSNGMKVNEMLDQSISMPTVTHNETSFKVGVGDSDVSSSIVDSSVSKMVIKGQTYQNILPEPSTHVLTNNKEMFKVNEGLDPNVEIVDGISKSAILKGNTLVNLVANPTHTFTQTSTINETWKQVNKYFTVDLQVGKTYIALWDMTWTNNDFSPSPSHFSFRNVNNNAFGTYDRLPSGKYYCKATLRDGIVVPTMFRFHTSVGTAIENTLTVSNFIVLEYQEGMENWDIPYFEGMQSVKMPVLTTTGKNLLDPQTFIPFNKEEDYVRYEDGYVLANFTKDRTHFFYKVDLTKLPKGMYTVIAKHEGESSYLGIQLTFKDGTKTWGRTQFNNDGSCTELGLYMQSTTNDPSLKVKAKIMLVANGDTASPYEDYKTNILHTPKEVVLRSLPNGVKDTLNLNTGEYVQRIGEVVLNGSEAWNKDTTTGGTKDNTSIFHTEVNFNGFKPSPNVEYRDAMMLCDKIPVKGRVYNLDEEGLMINGDGRIYIRINLSRLETNNAGGFKSFLAKENIKIQCELATPVIKTVDLSSSGNWEKIILNGSENWSVASESPKNNAFFRSSNIVPNNVKVNSNNVAQKVICDILTPFTQDQICNKPNDNYGISLGWNDSNLCVRHRDFPLTNEGLTQWKQYLSQNPITVWYQTTNHKDSTQVKQPIFFKDGHIIQSSGVDNSLIPTLDYQAKTSNSYVMDLMKTNTKYTMKAKTASGTFTIDGTSYGAGTNGTFTTPSSMTNKLLVMSNKTNTEVMILEGDVVSKTIPYFKGIKSAFEGEDKIEVLSTGKNLFDGELEKGNFNGGTNNIRSSTFTLEELRTYTISNDKNYSANVVFHDDNNQYISEISASKLPYTFTTPLKTKYVWIRTWSNQDDLTVNFQIEESSTATTHEPHKSNSTKIPLLSPLRSLPNGVCDELIIDRMKNKATLIQRVGYVKFDNMDKLGFGDDGGNQYIYLISDRHIYFANRIELASAPAIFSHFAYYTDGNLGTKDRGDYAAASDIVFCWCMPTKRDKGERERHLRNLAKQDGVVVQYQLKNPVVSEVDLEGFPYIYKDGHIFLNGEIVPVTEIVYSINQCQQISASNEDIIRHEKELTYLQKLIAQYVQVNYESALLSLKV